MKAVRYVAFLRAINVGGHVVKMDALRREFEALGLSNVETFIASGNVVFGAAEQDTSRLEGKIAARLARTLGYEVATFVRTTEELAGIAAHEPFPEAATKAKTASLYVGFVADRLSPTAKKALLALRTKTDDLHLHRREIYWLSTTGFSRSEFSPARMERTLGVAATFRNVTTVRKMAAKFAGPEAG